MSCFINKALRGKFYWMLWLFFTVNVIKLRVRELVLKLRTYNFFSYLYVVGAMVLGGIVSLTLIMAKKLKSLLRSRNVLLSVLGRIVLPGVKR
jgi:hypothetical protein